MKVVALISGGKDSCYNMLRCVADGHEIVALANLSPQGKDELDSYMYQTVGHQAVSLYAEAMNLPLFSQTIEGSAINTEQAYVPTAGDEVEDLYKLLCNVKNKMDVDAVSVGAIVSSYQQVRVQNICDRLDLKVLAYLWQRDQAELLREMIACGIKAIVIKVAALGLNPRDHLGSSIEDIFPHMLKMKDRYGLNVCGEGGEYETFTLDSPLFKKSIVIDDREVVVHSNDAFAPVAYLKFNKMHLVDKGLGERSQRHCITDIPLLNNSIPAGGTLPNEMT